MSRWYNVQNHKYQTEYLSFWPIHIESLLLGGYLRRTINNRRELLAEVRVAIPEAVHSDTNETQRVQLGQCAFHRRM